VFPNNISSLKDFVEEFLKDWDLGFHKFEEIYQKLLVSLQVEGILHLLKDDMGIVE
jgi:hypothetical protein